MHKAVIFILDRSGSMKDIRDNTIASMNNYREELRRDPEIEFTLVQFDTIGTDVVRRAVPILELAEFTLADLEPRAGTPLIDAVYIAIKTAQDKYGDQDKVVVTIMTDGHENASREFKLAELHDLIKERSEAGWQFVFLGASIDAYADSRKFGIAASGTMSYNSANLAQSQRAYAAAGAATMDWMENSVPINFSDKEKTAVGDKFNPGNGTGGGGAPAKPGLMRSLIGKVKL